MPERSKKPEKRRLSIGVSVLILIIAIVVSSLAFLLINQRRGSDFSYTLSGAVKLTYWEDAKGTPVILEKGWEFYPHRVLTPEMIHASRLENATERYPYYRNVQITTDGWIDMGDSAELYTFGKQVNKMEQYGIGTYRIEIILNENVDFVTINIPDIAQSAVIWVNGKAVRHYGTVSDNTSLYEPVQVCTDIQLEPASDGSIEIVIGCANYSSPYGGILCSPCVASTATIGTIEYSVRMYLTVLCAFWVFFLIGGHYISKTFVSQSKFYFFLLMFLGDIMYEMFSPMVTLLPGTWNMLIKITFLVLTNYFTFLFFFSLYPRGTSKLFDKLRFFEISFFSILTVCYLMTFWCFPSVLYLDSSVAANLIFVIITNLYNIFRVCHMTRRFNHGKYLYASSVAMTTAIHLSVFFRRQYVVYISLHAFLLLFLAVGFTLYFVMDYVKTYEMLADNNRNLSSAVEERTKYISRVNQELLDNHQKLVDNEEARKKMMSNVSHDLRTPITAIRGYVELMLNAKEPLSREQEVQYLNNMHTRSVQMEQLISDLVQLTRMESENDTLELMPVSIVEMVHDLFQLYKAECEGTGKVITFHAPQDDDLLIDGDPKKLLRVFENIIVNAMKYTREDGKIDIICHRYEDPAMLGGNAVEVCIKDNGVGIPENEVPYVFDRFYRAENSGINKTGSGLGLSIVKSVIDRHGGKIWVESEEGKGSEFHIVLKASEYSFDEEAEDE
ncbi:MAG: HAMP domain-containing histidine kinase [Clostridiales bacterium]|nr:HAMP domain-containing histidine kinase [Clostridiales bacterium]